MTSPVASIGVTALDAADAAEVAAGDMLARARAAAAEVLDPELPVLTIGDLGVLRSVDLAADDTVVVTITPTYSGCPAMDAIRTDLLTAVRGSGAERVEIVTVLSPAWTTDWISAVGREALLRFGIAPPGPARHRAAGEDVGPVFVPLSARPVEAPACPQCSSVHTREISRFGSTACKSQWVCVDCREPFDHVKAI